MGRQRVPSVMGYVEHSYFAACSIDALADISGLSRYHSMRLFKADTGRRGLIRLGQIRRTVTSPRPSKRDREKRLAVFRRIARKSRNPDRDPIGRNRGLACGFAS